MEELKERENQKKIEQSEANDFLWSCTHRISDDEYYNLSHFCSMEDTKPLKERFDEKSTMFKAIRLGYSSEVEFADKFAEDWRRSHKGKDKDYIPFVDFSFYWDCLPSLQVLLSLVDLVDQWKSVQIVALYIIGLSDEKVHYYDPEHRQLSLDTVEAKIPKVHIIICRTDSCGRTKTLDKNKLADCFRNLIAHNKYDFSPLGSWRRPYDFCIHHTDYKYDELSRANWYEEWLSEIIEKHYIEYDVLPKLRDISSLMSLFERYKDFIDKVAEKSALLFSEPSDFGYDTGSKRFFYEFGICSDELDCKKLSSFISIVNGDEIKICSTSNMGEKKYRLRVYISASEKSQGNSFWAVANLRRCGNLSLTFPSESCDQPENKCLLDISNSSSSTDETFEEGLSIDDDKSDEDARVEETSESSEEALEEYPL